jgi:hypothetical protein
MNIKVKALSKAEIAAMFDKPKMSEGEAAARLYLGRKQAEKDARIDCYFLIAWAFLCLAVLTVPFVLMMGA